LNSPDAVQALGALAHEHRLAIYRMLVEQGPEGLAAGVIAERLGIAPSSLTFHLQHLQRAGLIDQQRVSRQLIYAADFAAMRALVGFLTENCCGGKPELCGDLACLLPEMPYGDPGMTAAFNVLFLCTHNSARSIMAEAILRKIGGTHFRAYSAGSNPIAEPNPEVMEKLRTLGHDTGTLRSKSWHELTGPSAPRMDFVITLCDTLDGQICPDFGDLAVTGAWPLPDPVKFTGSAIERAAMLNMLYASLRRRLEIFTSLPFASLDRMAMKARLDEIADGGLPANAGFPSAGFH